MCEWCGHEHAVTALCPSAPRSRGINRRSFLLLGAAAAIGAALPSVPLPAAAQPVYPAPLDLAALAKEAQSVWEFSFAVLPDGKGVKAIDFKWEHVEHVLRTE